MKKLYSIALILASLVTNGAWGMRFFHTDNQNVVINLKNKKSLTLADNLAQYLKCYKQNNEGNIQPLSIPNIEEDDQIKTFLTNVDSFHDSIPTDISDYFNQMVREKPKSLANMLKELNHEKLGNNFNQVLFQALLNPENPEEGCLSIASDPDIAPFITNLQATTIENKKPIILKYNKGLETIKNQKNIDGNQSTNVKQQPNMQAKEGANTCNFGDQKDQLQHEILATENNNDKATIYKVHTKKNNVEVSNVDLPDTFGLKDNPANITTNDAGNIIVVYNSAQAIVGKKNNEGTFEFGKIKTYNASYSGAIHNIFIHPSEEQIYITLKKNESNLNCNNDNDPMMIDNYITYPADLELRKSAAQLISTEAPIIQFHDNGKYFVCSHVRLEQAGEGVKEIKQWVIFNAATNEEMYSLTISNFSQPHLQQILKFISHIDNDPAIFIQANREIQKEDLSAVDFATKMNSLMQPKEKAPKNSISAFLLSWPCLGIALLASAILYKFAPGNHPALNTIGFVGLASFSSISIIKFVWNSLNLKTS